MAKEVRKSDVERMVAILRDLGIEMSVGGCGCCGSPWVSFAYKGEKIIDQADSCDFDTAIGETLASDRATSQAPTLDYFPGQR